MSELPNSLWAAGTPARPRRSTPGRRAKSRPFWPVGHEHERRFYPSLRFLFGTGARRGEMLGIKWSDVDLENRRVTIRRAIVHGEVTTPKSGKQRQIAISPGLVEMLFELLGARRQEAIHRGWPSTPEWVFCSETGGPVDPGNFGWRTVDKAPPGSSRNLQSSMPAAVSRPRAGIRRTRMALANVVEATAGSSEALAAACPHMAHCAAAGVVPRSNKSIALRPTRDNALRCRG